MLDSRSRREPNVYQRIIARIFEEHYRPGAEEIVFQREEITATARALGVPTPKNVGDVIYALRYRARLPQSIVAKAPPGKSWIIRPAGQGIYRIVAVPPLHVVPNSALAETKVPDATPGVIAMYALGDEQALLARLRYSRLVDIFTGLTCYLLQSHLRTTVAGLGQVEVDEIYVGVDRRGAHYVLPVEAKGGGQSLGPVQFEQCLAVWEAKFGGLLCRPIGAQSMAAGLIALFEFEDTSEGLRVVSERHYRLVPPDSLSPEELAQYQTRPD